MTDKNIYIMGRAEYLSERTGISLSTACKIAETEWEERYGDACDIVVVGRITRVSGHGITIFGY